jgi:hypothetical protein
VTDPFIGLDPDAGRESYDLSFGPDDEDADDDAPTRCCPPCPDVAWHAPDADIPF